MRKGHGSSKVPNVKLRPAATKKSSARSLSPPPEDHINEATILNSANSPLSGFSISVSGLAEKKSAILKKAHRLGAHTSYDLTDKVTHLICDDGGSKKYKYCVEHGIPILKSSWIHSLFNAWEAGDEIDVKSSLESHRLPTFANAALCITGIDDLPKREEIQKAVEQNGGTFVKELTPKTTITHLICGGEKGQSVDERGWTKKMQFVEKLCLKTKKQIWLVWEEWLWDSLDFKGLLDETGYLVTKKRPGRRDPKRALTPLAEPIATGPSRQKSIPPSIPSSSLLVPGDNEEVAAVKRSPAKTTQLLGGLLKSRGFEVKGGKLIRSPSKVPSMPPPPSPSPLAERPDSEKGKESSLSAIKRSKSFAVSDANSIKTPFARIRSTSASSFASSSAVTNYTSSTSLITPSTLTTTTSILGAIREEEEIPEGEKSLFIGLRFMALGEADTPTLHQALLHRGGTIVQSQDDDDPDFIIVRLASGDHFVRKEPQDIRKARYRTECWVEQCIFAERLCLPDEHPSYTPLLFQTPIEGVDRLVVHISGLNQGDKITSLRLLKAIGAKVTDQLSRLNTHLICPLRGGAKVVKAQEWNIPVVTVDWLHHIATKGSIPLPDEYLLVQASSPLLQESASASAVPVSVSVLAEAETHFGMKDITNSNKYTSGESRSQEKSDDKTKTKPIPKSMGCSEEDGSGGGGSSFGKNNGLLSVFPNVPSSNCDDDFLSNQAALSSEVPLAEPSSSSVLSLTTELPLKSDDTNVPSSNTPSPIKLASGASFSSPFKSSGGDSNADMLKDTIVSLLGKRHSSDDSEQAGNKIGKRAKAPPRSKSRQNVFSRHTSMDKLPQAASPSDYPLIIEDTPNSSFLGKEAADESIRVTYEDPAQRDEKIRLMTLLSSQPPPPPPPPPAARRPTPPPRRGKNLVRKSRN